MGVSWTDDQRKVIDLRKRNILVSAAAGSGKTAVLVERIKELILDKENPVAMDELLVVTFTKAAAAQMRDRIGAAIENELLGQPQNMYLQQQLALLYHAQITTIDSFCLYVIRNHFHEISLDPNFRIADEGELKLLAGEVLDNLLEQEYGKGDEGFLQLADIYASGRNDDGLKALVLQLYEYARSYPFPKEWLHHCEEGYCYETVEELMSSALFESLLTYTSYVADGIAQSIRRALRICQEEDGPYMYEKALKSDMEQIEGFLACQGYEAVLKWLKTVNWATLKADRSFQGSKEKQEYVKAARNGWKKTVDTLQKKYFFLTPEELAAQLIRIRPLVGELVQLTLHYMEAFAARKRERNIVDFGDLEHFALEILVDGETKEPTAAAKEFQHAYAQIMIDEYQDSNYVQETILRAVSREASGENNIFMVGDVKQSIYRFRLARPELFMEKYDTYSLEDSDKQRVDLHQNFRSRNEVLDITNHIFAAIMHKSLGNVEYDKAAALYPGASYPAMKHMFEPEILLADTKDELLEEAEHADKASLEAMLIATKLREMMDSQLVTDEDTKELRRMRYGDVVILLRSLSGYADTFVEVLTDYGIPVHTASKTGYFSAIEVQTVLNYLRILDNPFQDIPLAAILRSPVGGFTEEELAKIRIAEPDGLFSEAFFRGITKQEYDKALSEKTEAFLKVFEMLRAETADRPIHEILMMV